MPMMRSGVVRVELYGAPEFMLGAVEIPIVVGNDLRQRSMCFRQIIIYRKRRHCHCLSLRHPFLWWSSAKYGKQRVRVCQTRLRQRVTWIFVDGLLEIRNGSVEVIECALVPVKTAFQIKLISFRVGGVALRDALLFHA